MNEAGGEATQPISAKGRLSWAIFEWARNPYFQLINIFLFSTYFSRDIIGDPVRGQALWGDIIGYAGLAVALLAPVLGAIADAGGPRKPWIAFYAGVLAAACIALWFAMPAGQSGGMSIFAIGATIAIASVAYEFSTVFHNAMLPSLVDNKHVGTYSGLGYGLGNAASVLLLVFVAVAFYIPADPLFHLDRALHEHDRVAGPLAAVWLTIFSVPFFLWTPDTGSAKLSLMQAVGIGLRSVATTIRNLKHYKNVAIYLAARAIYNDGMTAVLVFGGVYASGIFRWQATEMAVFGITLCFFAMIGGFLGGYLADRVGARIGLFITLTGTLIGAVLSLGFAPDRIFFVIPYESGHAIWNAPLFRTLPEILYLSVVIIIAIFIVAAYANSRAMLARIAPFGRMTEFFGLYALSGTATTFLAPFAVGLATSLSGSQQWGMAAIVAFLVVGLFGLTFVREERSQPL